MSHLILKTQLEVLKHNLEEVQLEIESIQGKDLRQILELPPELRAEDVRRLRRLVTRAEDAMNDRLEDELREAISSLRLVVEGLKTRLGPADIPAGALDRRAPVRLGDFQAMFNDEIGDAVLAETLTRIGELEQKLKQVMVLEAAGQDDDARKIAHEAWQVWAHNVVPASAKVFSEYVEFLGGLALRYTGFDRGICRIADDLIHEAGRVPGFTWASVTLPAQREAISSTQVIGLGFPEWTVWALPLGAHALGLTALRESYKMRALVEETAAVAGCSEDQARDCLADAFATYAMGPAYACAAILLRLDPVGALNDEGLIARRAQYVLRTLKHLNDLDPNGFATTLLTTLASEWEQAMQEAGHDPATTGGLGQAEIDQIDEAVRALAGRLGKSRAYKGERWPATVVPWAEALAGAQAKDIGDDLEAEEGDMLRDVLNAAWLCRYQAIAGDLDLKEIDTQAKHLWERLTRVEPEASGQDVNWLTGSSAEAKPQPPGREAERNGQR